MTHQPSEAQAEAVSMKRPTAVTILIVLTALFVWRASAFFNLASVGVPPDGAPESWFIPLLGDGLVGTAAIIMAIVLWRRQTAGVWLAAVVVHTVAPQSKQVAAIDVTVTILVRHKRLVERIIDIRKREPAVAVDVHQLVDDREWNLSLVNPDV